MRATSWAALRCYNPAMIIVHGVFPIRADSRQRALKLMEDMAMLSREEPGCLTYEFYAALSSETEFLLFQEWESIEALQDHFETPHMETFLTELPDVLDGEIVTRRYEVRSRDRGIDNERVLSSSGEVERKSERQVPKIVH
jgi:quinol monooxygenase YgiN